MLSDLAEHTQNLAARSEASALVVDTGGAIGVEDPLARGRVTLVGPCTKVAEGESLRARETFLAENPAASRYASFGDFACYRLEPIAVRYVGGFGRMAWVAPEAYRSAQPDPLAHAANRIVAHMNDDHADAVLAYARTFAGVADAKSARMTAVDRYGFELEVETDAGSTAARLPFDAPVRTGDDVRQAMVALLRRARSRGV